MMDWNESFGFSIAWMAVCARRVHREVKQNLETPNESRRCKHPGCQRGLISFARGGYRRDPSTPIRGMSAYRTAALGAKRTFDEALGPKSVNSRHYWISEVSGCDVADRFAVAGDQPPRSRTAATLARVLRQIGNPPHTPHQVRGRPFPVHALVSRGAALLSSSIEIHRPRNAGRS
jgi:hypothetical protein